MWFLKVHRLLGSRIFQYLAAVTGTLGILSCEMHYGWTSPSLPVLLHGNYTIHITHNEGAWLPAVLLVGTILGAIFSGIYADDFGRRLLILISAVPIFFSWIIIGFACSIYHIYAARFIAGLANGICFSVIPMYLAEIAEVQVRGMLASLCPVFIVAGFLIINLIGNHLPIDQTAFVSSIFPLLLVLSFWHMPESPIYLLLKRKNEEAKKSLQILRGDERGLEEYERLQNELFETKEKESFLDLFKSTTNRKAMYITLGLRTCQQLCGTSAITFYCKMIFKEAEDFISPNHGTIIYFSVQLVLAFASSLIVDYTGRRPLLIISSIGTALSLFMTSAYLYLKNCTDIEVSHISFIPLLSLLFYVIFFNIGLRTIPLLMIGEMFSPTCKSMAVCFAAIYHSVIVIIISKFFYYSSEYLGIYIPFLTFGISCLLSLIFIIRSVPETKGKTLEDIQKDLQEGSTKEVEIREERYIKY